MSFADLKKDAKQSLNPNFGYYLLLFLPIFILQISVGIIESMDRSVSVQTVTEAGTEIVSEMSDSVLGFELLLMVLLGMLTIGVMFVLIDHGRNRREYKQAASGSFTTFSRGDYFWGVLGMGLLIYIYTVLWTFLLIIPGFIKAYSYSQAFYIYRDHLDQGEKISFNQAITESRQMMKGHKWELFLLQLSFIGWGLLCIFVIPYFWVAPYYYQTVANYYVQLSAAKTTDKSDDDLMSIVR